VLYPLSYEGEGRLWDTRLRPGRPRSAPMGRRWAWHRSESPPCAQSAWRRVRIAAVSWSAGRNASRRSSETVTTSAVTNVEIVAPAARRRPANEDATAPRSPAIRPVGCLAPAHRSPRVPPSARRYADADRALANRENMAAPIVEIDDPRRHAFRMQRDPQHVYRGLQQ
jgi:hypothetical protein